MPAADAVLLPLCVGLALLGILVTGIGWRRGNKGRVVQGVGLTLAPVALFFSGLLRLLWDGGVALVGWASRMVFTPTIWFGLSLLAVCLVLWVVGGILARRAPAKSDRRTVTKGAQPAVAAGQPARRTPSKQATPADPVDDEMAEIEALLKKRGIQ